MSRHAPAAGLTGDAVRFLRVFGIVAAAWTSLLAAAAPSVEHPAVLLAGLAALWAWALASLRLPAGVVWWGGWLVAGLLTQLLGPVAGTAGWSLAGGAPFVSLAGAALTGRRTPVVLTATVLSAGAVARGLLDSQLAASLVTVLIFAFGGLALAWLVRIVRRGETEREHLRRQVIAAQTERAVAMERNEAAARLHDSVLQSLAAIQQAADLDRAKNLARETSGELRSWLRHRNTTTGTFREALEEACRTAASENDVTVSVAGQRPMDEAGRLLVAAVAEAVRNAEAHGAPPIRVYAETMDGATTVWVADRGQGFDLDRVPADRMGIRGSIVGRLERAGGHAHVTSGPDGTEWTLTIPAEEPPSVADPGQM